MRFAKAFVALSAPFLFTSAAPAYKRADPTDLLVVKFALALNQLESSFYDEALAKFKPADFLAAGFSAAEIPLEQYRSISLDEKAHIAFLQEALKAVGDVPISGCKFDFSSVLGDVATMSAVSRVLENVGVSAFIGAAALLSDKNILAAAAGIVSIESRHSSIANVLNGGASIPSAFDMGLTPSSVLALAGGFISGCDFGIPANPPLKITNQGAVTVGSKLTFSSPGIDKALAAGQPLSCAMLTGGDVVSQSFPIDNCVVPSNITGPVYIYITNSPQQLAANLNDQCATCISAGPTLAFIDSEPQALGALARNSGTPGTPGKAIGADPAAGAPSGSTPGSPAPGTTAPGSSDPTAPSSTSPGAPSTGGAIPSGSAQQDNKAGGSTPGLSAFDGGVVVIGASTIPKAQLGLNPAAPAPAPASSSSATVSGAAAETGDAQDQFTLPTSAAIAPVPTPP
jgi:hypothetical protein